MRKSVEKIDRGIISSTASTKQLSLDTTERRRFRADGNGAELMEAVCHDNRNGSELVRIFDLKVVKRYKRKIYGKNW